jgi:hypothetical protein
MRGRGREELMTVMIFVLCSVVLWREDKRR